MKIKPILVAAFVLVALCACTPYVLYETANDTPMEVAEVIEIVEVIVPIEADSIEWLSPMLTLNLSGENNAAVYGGQPLFEVSNNDLGRENRGRIVTEAPVEGQTPMLATLTGEELVAQGAVRLTTGFAYDGDERYSIRFRFRLDRFQGHSITGYGLGANTGALILWQDENGDWWNVHRTGWGGEFTGGTDTPGWFYPETHATLAGTPYSVFTFDVNKENAARFAEQDFYAVFLEEVPFRRDDDGNATDYMSGYVITYQAELPDGDGHFHNFNVLASASTYVNVPETEKPDVCDQDHDDDDHDDDCGGHH
jgi:hypothetical protein